VYVPRLWSRSLRKRWPVATDSCAAELISWARGQTNKLCLRARGDSRLSKKWFSVNDRRAEAAHPSAEVACCWTRAGSNREWLDTSEAFSVYGVLQCRRLVSLSHETLSAPYKWIHAYYCTQCLPDTTPAARHQPARAGCCSWWAARVANSGWSCRNQTDWPLLLGLCLNCSASGNVCGGTSARLNIGVAITHPQKSIGSWTRPPWFDNGKRETQQPKVASDATHTLREQAAAILSPK